MHLPRAAGALHRRQLALRVALHLRPAGPPVLHDRRTRRDGATRRICPSRLGKIHRVNDDGSVPKDNPFVEQGRRGADDLELRPPQSAGARVGSGDRQAVGVRARPAGRRRDQHHRAGPELRLGRDHAGHPAGHHQARRAGHGAADRLLHADDCAERDDVLHRQPVSGVEEQPVRRRRSPGSSSAGSRSSGDKVTHQEVVFNQFGRVHDVVQGPDGCST